MNYRYLFLFIIVCLLLIGCASPTKQIKQFEAAINENNPAALHDLVEIPEKLLWTESAAADVVSYFLENETVFSEQMTALEEQKNNLKTKEVLNNKQGIFYFNDDKQLTVRAYQILIDPKSYLAFERLTVNINDKEIESEFTNSNEDIIIDNIGPGSYELTANADYGYTSLADQATLELFQAEQFKNTLTLALDGQQVSVMTTNPNTKVFIDEFEIIEALDMNENITIQPVTPGLTVLGKASFSWGDLISESLIIEDGLLVGGFDLTPRLFADEAERKEIASVITDFNGKLLRALAENNPKYLRDVKATEKAIAGYDEQFEKLTAVQKGELSESSFPHGIGRFVVGQYRGGLLESLIDFSQPTVKKDQETGEDILSFPVSLYTDFMYIPESEKQNFQGENVKGYLKPEVSLAKIEDEWVITEQLIMLVGTEETTDLVGDHVVATKVK